MLLITGFVLFIWSLLRLVRLPETLYFFNDMGRDLLVVWQSWHDKKPFLLGPQNSALPFNQPALYFYLLYPAFLLTGMSLYTHTVTFMTVAGGLLLAMTKWLWASKRRAWILVWLPLIWLMAIQPEFVAQNRFIWNPSFVAYSLLPALFCYVLLLSRRDASSNLSWKSSLLWFWALVLGTALAFSYSVIPFALAWSTLILWQWRAQSWKFAASLVAVSIMWQIPTLAFELRYNFQLTRAVLWGERLPQVNLGWWEKLQQLSGYFTGSNTDWINLMIWLGIALLVVFNWRQIRQTPAQHPDTSFKLGLTLTTLTLIFTWLIPVAVQAHYVFGLFMAILLMIASLRPKFLLIALAGLTVWWLQPALLKRNINEPPRTLAQTEQCGQIVCKQISEPVFVSVESGLHPYHNGPEWRFILAKHGCDVKAIELEPKAAGQMIVVEDNGTYHHGQTDFYELGLFGPSNVVDKIDCTDGIGAIVLKKY